MTHFSFMRPTFVTIFALPHVMAQHSCETLRNTDTPSTVPSVIQASSAHTWNPICAHNPIETQCNQSLVLITHVQVRTTKPNPPTLWLPHVHQIMGVCSEDIFSRPRGVGFLE